MSNPRWVTTHGKEILVETLETPSTKAPGSQKATTVRQSTAALGGGRGQRDGNARRHGLDFTAAHGLENEEHDVPAIQCHVGAIRRRP